MVLPVLLLAACDLPLTPETVRIEGDDIACDDDVALDDEWAAELEEVHGCGWHLRALDRYETLRLTLDAVEFVAALDGEAASATYALPDDRVRVTLEVGCDLGVGVCTDVSDAREPDFNATYEALSGTADVGVETDGTAWMTLTGVTLQSEHEDAIPLSGTFTAVLEAEE